MEKIGVIITPFRPLSLYFIEIPQDFHLSAAEKVLEGRENSDYKQAALAWLQVQMNLPHTESEVGMDERQLAEMEKSFYIIYNIIEVTKCLNLFPTLNDETGEDISSVIAELNFVLREGADSCASYIVSGYVEKFLQHFIDRFNAIEELGLGLASSMERAKDDCVKVIQLITDFTPLMEQKIAASIETALEEEQTTLSPELKADLQRNLWDNFQLGLWSEENTRFCVLNLMREEEEREAAENGVYMRFSDREDEDDDEGIYEN
jgi:hypothetical protein